MEQQEMDIAQACKVLGIPEMKNEEDLQKFMVQYGKTEDRKIDEDIRRTKTVQIPRIPLFYGEVGKGEVSYSTWAHELKCLVLANQHEEDVLLQAIRKSLRGEAADVLRRCGVEATVKQILKEFEANFGDIDTPETILKKFYAIKMNEKESVFQYIARIEEMFNKAVNLAAVNSNKNGCLRSVFYNGLNMKIKQAAAVKFELVKDYDQLKIEVRKIENEINTGENESEEIKTNCNATSKNKQKNETEERLTKVETLLEKLNVTIAKLAGEGESNLNCQQQQSQPQPEYSQQQQHQSQPEFYQQPEYSQQQQHQRQPEFYQPLQFNKGPRHFRGAVATRMRAGLRTPYRGQGRGESSYRVTRPTAGNTFTPECFNCRGKGHIARNCPQQQGPQCYNCHGYGHYARNCLNN